MFTTARTSDFSKIQEGVNNLVLEAYSCSDIISKLMTIVIASDLKNLQKSKLLDKIAEIESFLADGADEHVNLLNIFSYVQVVSKMG